MRKLTLGGCMVAASFFANAQFYKSVLPSGAFTDSLQIVVADYQQNFFSLQSENISELSDVDIYKSNKSIPGAKECFVFRFHSVEDTTASWQAIMFKGEDYKEAVKAYKNCFRLVRKSHLKIGENTLKFEGDMVEPEPSLKFTVSSLRPITVLKAYDHFYAEVELVQVYFEWEVRLNLHSRKPDAEKYNY